MYFACLFPLVIYKFTRSLHGRVPDGDHVSERTASDADMPGDGGVSTDGGEAEGRVGDGTLQNGVFVP